MLAAAESDLEPDLVDRDGEQRRQLLGCGLAQIEREARQQGFDQSGLTRAKPMTFAPPEEAARRWRIRYLRGHSCCRRVPPRSLAGSLRKQHPGSRRPDRSSP